jgi:protein-S-isoprenylcysteine O-methyltransferase Ste14
MVNRMSTDAAHTSRWRTFEVIVGIPFLAGIALHLAVPVVLPRVLPASILSPAGGALFVVGMALVVLARRELARHGQPTDPGHPTDELVTGGVYAFSGATSADAFMDLNPKLLDSGIMMTHYSAEVLFSPAARAAFVEPDLTPIPESPTRESDH